MKTQDFLIYLFGILFFFTSCHKTDHSGTGSSVKPPPVEINVAFSVQGRVTDENGSPVEGAIIKSSLVQGLTDLSGYFFLTNVNSSDQNAMVTVEKPGYFKGRRTFVPLSNNINSVYIQLIARSVFKSVDGSVGGTVTFISGVQLEFPAKSFVTSTGLSYTGTTNVYASYLNPVDTSFLIEMPGDLRAIDTSGKSGVLRSFGMADIELETNTGQPLQIAQGIKVKLTMPIQNIQRSVAPSEIPLWYWNDSTGFWKQEGTALKVANTYSGYVSHFTYWNFDIQNGYTYIKAKFVTSVGNPVSYRRLVVTAVDGTFEYDFYACRSSDQGKINALAPIIIGSRISLLDDCGKVLYTQTLSPLFAPLDLGTIIVANAPNTLTIKGKVVDCSNNPISNSKVFISIASRLEIVKPGADGTFILQTIGCSSTNQFKLYAINNGTNEQNMPQTFNFLNHDTLDVGNVIVCNNFANEFIQIIRNTDTFNYRFPECTKIFGEFSQPNLVIDSSRTNIFALSPVSVVYSGIILNHVPISFTAPGNMNIYKVHISTADSIPSYDPVYMAAAPVMKITEYGSIGQYIAGTYSGPLNESGYHLVYNFKISFRVKRTQ